MPIQRIIPEIILINYALMIFSMCHCSNVCGASTRLYFRVIHIKEIIWDETYQILLYFYVKTINCKSKGFSYLFSCNIPRYWLFCSKLLIVFFFQIFPLLKVNQYFSLSEREIKSWNVNQVYVSVIFRMIMERATGLLSSLSLVLCRTQNERQPFDLWPFVIRSR